MSARRAAWPGLVVGRFTQAEPCQAGGYLARLWVGGGWGLRRQPARTTLAGHTCGPALSGAIWSWDNLRASPHLDYRATRWNCRQSLIGADRPWALALRLL